MIKKLAVLTRYLLGFDFFVNGVNWWWKILPYPALNDPPDAHTPHFVQAMIDSGFLFGAIKGVEVIAGLALLTNRFVPLALVIAFPVTVAAWAVDVGLLTESFRAQVMGWSLFTMNAFLMVAYLDSYRALLHAHATPGQGWETAANRHER